MTDAAVKLEIEGAVAARAEVTVWVPKSSTPSLADAMLHVAEPGFWMTTVSENGVTSPETTAMPSAAKFDSSMAVPLEVTVRVTGAVAELVQLSVTNR